MKTYRFFLLQFRRDLHRELVGWSRAGDRGKARGRAVDKFDAAFAHDDIVGGPEPDALNGIGAHEILAGLDHLAGEQRRHAGVERLAEVGQPHLFGRTLRQELFRPFKDPPQIGQRLHFLAGERIDDRQIVGGVGKPDRAGLALGRDGLGDLGIGLGHPGDGSVDGAGAN